MEWLRAMLASLWPQKQVRWWYPSEPYMLVRATAITGALEFLVFASLECMQLRAHVVANANHFANGNAGTQLVALFVVVIAELFYPLSALLIVMATEGFIRFVAGAIVHQPVPAFWLALGVKLWRSFGAGAKRAAVPR